MSTYASGSSGGLGFAQVITSSGRTTSKNNTVQQFGSITVPTGKVSVDEGEFIPGIYRVNPYKVFGGACNLRDDFPGNDEEVGFENRWATYGLRNETYTFSYEYGAYTYYAWFSGSSWRPSVYNYANAAIAIREAADFEQLSLQKAKSKLGQADLDMGETLGEYRETIQMLRHPLSGLKKFLLDDKSRNFRLLAALAKGDKRQVNRLLGRTGKASAETMAGTWLEIRYGLRPLISLVQDVIDRVNDQQVGILDPTKIRSARSKLTFGPFTEVYERLSIAGKFELRAEVVVEDTYVSTAAVQYRQATEQSFLDTLGLTPRFLPEVAWQLTRLSFVVDWVLSVGPWLASLRINPGITTLGNTSGFKHIRKMHIRSAGIRYSNSLLWPLKPLPPSNDLDFVELISYDRKVDLDMSYLPHFTWGRTLDLFKAIDSLSLLWQVIAKHRG